MISVQDGFRFWLGYNIVEIVWFFLVLIFFSFLAGWAILDNYKTKRRNQRWHARRQQEIDAENKLREEELIQYRIKNARK